MKEELVQVTAARLEAEQSHDTLLQRVKEMEKEMEREKEQVRERFGKICLSVIIILFIFLKVTSLGEASSSRLPRPEC